jgi:hypothetical protein
MSPLPAIADPLPAMSPLPAIPEPLPMSLPAIGEPDAGVGVGSSVFFFLQAVTLNARDRANMVIAVRIRFLPIRMLQRFGVQLLPVTLLLLVCTAVAIADTDVRLPPGTRADSTGQLVSTRGLRDTTDFIAKDLDKRGIAFKQIGPYRVRAAEVTRFLSQSPSTTWLAIHVLRVSGKTLIFFVPRPAS